MRLSEDQIRFFKREGYVILRGLLDPARMQQALDHIWAAAPPDMVRDDPRTWPGVFDAADGSGNWMDEREETIWRFRAPAQEPWALELLPEHPPVRAVAEQLLGRGRVPRPRQTRGFYCTRPETGYRSADRQCHVDKHPFNLGSVAYVDDVGPGGGGLALWPGSHRAFFGKFRSRYLFTPTSSYEPLIDELDRKDPVDCHGRAGDVVFFHHRIAHKAGHNDSDRLRLASLHDFLRDDLFDRLFVPPGDDPWCDWSDEVRSISID